MLKEFRTCSKLNSLAGRVTEFFCVTHFPFSVMRSLVLVVDSCFLLCTCVIILILDSIISHCSQEMSPRSSPESRVDKTRKSGGNQAYFDSRQCIYKVCLSNKLQALRSYNMDPVRWFQGGICKTPKTDYKVQRYAPFLSLSAPCQNFNLSKFTNLKPFNFKQRWQQRFTCKGLGKNNLFLMKMYNYELSKVGNFL